MTTDHRVWDNRRMRNITKAIAAVATSTALLLIPIHPSYASSLSSSSSPSTPVEPETPAEPVDDRPVAVRLVEAAEEFFVAEGFTIDPKLTAIAQEYGDRGSLPSDEMRALMEDAGYNGWGVHSSYGYLFHREADIREFQEGTHFMGNYHYKNVGVAVSKPSYDGRTYFVIVQAGFVPDEVEVAES